MATIYPSLPGWTETSRELQKSIEGGQSSMRPTERLFQSHGGAGWAEGQTFRRLRAEDWGLEHAVINLSFLGLPKNPRTFI